MAKFFAVTIRNGAYESWAPHPSGRGVSVYHVGAIERPNAEALRDALTRLGGRRSRPRADGAEVWHVGATYKHVRALRAAGFVMYNDIPIHFPAGRYDWIKLA